jgi:PhnB protein
MARRNQFEELDKAVQAMLTHPDAPLLEVDESLAPLLRIAGELRDLPREEFKARLKGELGRASSESVSQRKETERKVNPIPKGFHTVTPYIAVREALEVIEFIKTTFGAEGVIRGIGTGGGIHAEYRIGDSMLMIGGSGDWKGTPMPTALHVYVDDVDEVFERALKAGATVLRDPMDQPYGDRDASVKDVAGNHWYIAHHLKQVEPVEGFHTVTTYLHPKGAGKVIDFLERAFGATEVFRAESGGVIHHASVRLGNAVISMGEAHAEFQPMPTMFYLYVEDTDALYRRAIEAGAKSLYEPADQPYGDRNAGVEDPFGNQWYIATHVRDVDAHSTE